MKGLEKAWKSANVVAEIDNRLNDMFMGLGRCNIAQQSCIQEIETEESAKTEGCRLLSNVNVMGEIDRRINSVFMRLCYPDRR